MRADKLVPAMMLTLLVSVCASQLSYADMDADADSLQATELAFLGAMTDQDAERAAGFFAADAVLHIANMPQVQGRDMIARFYTNVFRFQRASESTPEHLAIASGADMAYSRGRVSNAFEGADGIIEYAGKYLLVWQYRDGRWEIVAYTLSNNQQTP